MSSRAGPEEGPHLIANMQIHHSLTFIIRALALVFLLLARRCSVDGRFCHDFNERSATKVECQALSEKQRS